MKSAPKLCRVPVPLMVPPFKSISVPGRLYKFPDTERFEATSIKSRSSCKLPRRAVPVVFKLTNAVSITTT